MRTLLPVGMTSMIALPSGWVLTSRLPSSTPSLYGWKTTWAPSIGFLLKPLSTVTSMCEVSGGALYLRPCCGGLALSSSWAPACRGVREANIASEAKRQRTDARPGWIRKTIRPFYADWEQSGDAGRVARIPGRRRAGADRICVTFTHISHETG